MTPRSNASRPNICIRWQIGRRSMAWSSSACRFSRISSCAGLGASGTSSLNSQERMGHPVEPCDVPLHTVPGMGDPHATVLLRYHMMLPLLPYGSELHSGHCVRSSLEG